MQSKPFVPQVGFFYTLRGRLADGSASIFKCLTIDAHGALMTNIVTGWTCYAHEIVRYENGEIEWAYSTGGHFEEVSA